MCNAYFIRSWKKGVLFPFHLFDDGGGVCVKVQPRAELKEPLRNDVQFVQGEINFDRRGIVNFVVLVVLRKGGERKE